MYMPKPLLAQYSLTVNSGMNFGDILFASNGAITLSATGGATGSGGAVSLGGSSAASLSATCPADQSISISANTPLTLVDSNGSGPGNMTIEEIYHNAPSVCDSFGNLGTFGLGARLRFGTVQPGSGNYNISLSITIDNL